MPRKNNVELMLDEVLQLYLAKRGPEDTADVLASRLVNLVDALGHRGLKLQTENGVAIVVIDNRPLPTVNALSTTTH